MRKTSFLTSVKRGTSCPKEGEEGGEVIRAMPERKHLFLWEVFPYSPANYFCLQLNDHHHQAVLPSFEMNDSGMGNVTVKSLGENAIFLFDKFIGKALIIRTVCIYQSARVKFGSTSRVG